MDRGRIEARVYQLADGLAGDGNLAVVDVAYRHARGVWTLEVCLYKDQGLTIDDCAFFSKALGDLLDGDGMLDGRYQLEITSPGLDRVLKTEREYRVFSGHKVEVRTGTPVNGRNEFTGTLEGLRDDLLLLLDDKGDVLEIPVELVRRTRLHAGL